MQSVDFELEELGVSKAVGFALQDANFGVGPFERPGRDAVVIVVENSAAVCGQGVSELNQPVDSGAFGSADSIIEHALGRRPIGLFPDPA